MLDDGRAGRSRRRRRWPTPSASTSSGRSRRADWHIKGPKGAAAALGLNPSTLYSRMKKLGIPNRSAGQPLTDRG